MLVFVFLLLCAGAVLSAVYGRCRFVKNKAKHLPCEKINAETEEGLISPLSTPTCSKGTVHRQTRLPGNAVVRSDFKSALSPVRNDDVPPVVTAVFGRSEGRYVHIT